jgi:hypothetical protein
MSTLLAFEICSQGTGWSIFTIWSIIQRCRMGLLYCGRSATEQVNDWKDEKSKAQTSKTLLHVPIFIVA